MQKNRYSPAFTALSDYPGSVGDSVVAPTEGGPEVQQSLPTDQSGELAPFILNHGKSNRGGFSDAEARRKLSLRWLDAIEHEQGVKSYEKVRDCGMDHALYECPNGHQKLIPIGCKRDYCPECSKRNETRRTMEAVEKLEDLDTSFFMVTFTVPDTWYRRLLWKADWVSVMGKCAQRAIERTWKGRVGGVFTQHLFSSRSPWVQGPHLHFLLPRYVLTKQYWMKGKQPRIVRDERGHPVLKKEKRTWFHLDDRVETPEEKAIIGLRDEYSRQMSEAFEMPRENMVVHVEIVTKAKMKQHTMKYIMRNPIDWDKVDMVNGRVAYGPPSKKVESSIDTFANAIVNYTHGVRVHYFGFLASRVKEELVVGVKVQEEEELREDCKCAECGARMRLENLFVGGRYVFDRSAAFG